MVAPWDPAPGQGMDDISGTVVTSRSSTFTSGTLTGLLNTTILTGDTSNGYGADKLTFIYELQNQSSSTSYTDPITSEVNYKGEGIIDLIVGGWLGVSTDFTLVSADPATHVQPDGATRDAISSTIDFSFPPGAQPPIFNGQTGFQLIIYTDATAWTDTTGTIYTVNFGAGGTPDIPDTARGVETFTAVAPNSVPDGGTTALLLGMGLLSLRVIAKRSKRA